MACTALLVPLHDVEVQAPRSAVCVTGATGYVAGHIIHRLLLAGHTVHATCRQPGDTSAVKHLLALPGASYRLQLHQADLLEPGSFDEAVRGCDYVIHTASPYRVSLEVGDPLTHLVRPAIEGTDNVLSSVNKEPTVKRVVLTSSTAAMFTDPHEKGKGYSFSEKDWNESATAEREPYFYSKTTAERRAFEACMAQSRWTLCTICPPSIWGPPMSSRVDSESVNQMLMILEGRAWPLVPPVGMGVVDVRDVALAHCLAMVTPGASGRYLINAYVGYPLLLASRLLRGVYPNYWISWIRSTYMPTLILGPWLGLPREMTRTMFGKKPVLDTSRASQELGMRRTIDPSQTMLDMAEQLVEMDLVRPRVSPFLVAMVVIPLLLTLILARWLA